MPEPIFTMPPEPVMPPQKAPAAPLPYGSEGAAGSELIVSVFAFRLTVAPVAMLPLMSEPIVSLESSTRLPFEL